MKRSARLAVLVILGAAVFVWAGAAHADMPVEADAITTHLEFHGYTRGDDEEWLSFSHEERLSFTVQSYQGGILIQSWFGGTDYADQHASEFHAVVNDMNAAATVMRLYVDDDGDLAMEAWYPGEYKKDTFSAFLDAWVDDGATLLGVHYDALSNLVE